MIADLERKIGQQPKEFVDEKEIRINDIHFVFKSKYLLEELADRKSSLLKGDADGIRDIDKRLDKIKDESYHKYGRPYAAYITFEHEEGAMRALALNKKSLPPWLGGQQLRF